MTRTHHLKTWPEPFEATRAGLKMFEVRKDDRGFAVGDVVVLCKWVPRSSDGSTGGHFLSESGGEVGNHTHAARVACVIRYMLHGGRFGLPDGIVVLGLVQRWMCNWETVDGREALVKAERALSDLWMRTRDGERPSRAFVGRSRPKWRAQGVRDALECLRDLGRKAPGTPAILVKEGDR